MKLLPEKEFIYYMPKEGLDSWGKITVGEEKILYKCYIKCLENTTGIETIGGKQCVPTYSISFNGSVSIAVGDLVEVDGAVKEVLRKSYIKDLSRRVLVTKITV